MSQAKRGRMDDRMGEESSSEEEDFDMDMDELKGVNVNMELKGLDIEEVDYHGIKQLLMPLLPSSGINLADITNDIIGANFVGHVIKQVDEVNQFADDEDPVLSITTMVPLGKQSWIGDLKKFLYKKTAEDSAAQNALSQYFSSNRNALFINTRYLNFPARAEGILSLLEDLNKAEKKKHKSNWKFGKVLMVIPRLHPKDSNEEDKEITYRHQEDELLEQGAEFKFEWNAEEDLRNQDQGSGWDEERLFTEHRMIAIIKYDVFKNYVNMLPGWLVATN